MNALHQKPAFITFKDALIIAALIFYVWFSYTADIEEEQRHRASQQQQRIGH